MKTKEKNQIDEISLINFAEKNGLKSYSTKIANHVVVEIKDETNYITCNLVRNITEIRSIMKKTKVKFFKKGKNGSNK